METKDVTYFSTLLSIKAEEVEGAITDGSLGEKVTALGLLGKDQVETLKTNYSKEVKTTYLTELVDNAKKGDLDEELFKVIKGATYEMLEKDLSKEYGVVKYDGVKDLVSKVIKDKTGQSNDKALQELTETHEALKKVNINLVEEKDKAITKAETDAANKLLKRDQEDVKNEVPFDYSNVKDEDLETYKTSRKETVETVFNARHTIAFEDDKVVVLKDGKVLVNSVTLESLPMLDVYKSISLELGIPLISPESGGQGGKSSGGKGGLTFATQQEFEDHLESKGIAPTSKEGIELFSKSNLVVTK